MKNCISRYLAPLRTKTHGRRPRVRPYHCEMLLVCRLNLRRGRRMPTRLGQAYGVNPSVTRQPGDDLSIVNNTTSGLPPSFLNPWLMFYVRLYHRVHLFARCAKMLETLLLAPPSTYVRLLVGSIIPRRSPKSADMGSTTLSCSQIGMVLLSSVVGRESTYMDAWQSAERTGTVWPVVC